jgi:hypothetical protein
MNSSGEASLIPVERIERAILFIRRQKVMLDRDLAALYGVETKVLNQAVKRNLRRFPEDFMFQLTWEETQAVTPQRMDTGPAKYSRSQSVTLKRGKNPRYRIYAFTEQGVAMLSSVLRSSQAVAVNIEIMRAFVRLRRMLASHADLARKLDALEQKYDAQFRVVFDAIRQLMEPPPAVKRRRIGFHARDEEK